MSIATNVGEYFLTSTRKAAIVMGGQPLRARRITPSLYLLLIAADLHGQNEEKVRDYITGKTRWSANAVEQLLDKGLELGLVRRSQDTKDSNE